jgi:PAS domain S-box-containing protein
MDGKIIECNSIFKKITGYKDEELHQKTYKDITPQEWHYKEAEIIKEQVLNRGYSNAYEKELIGKDGRIISVELRTYLIKQKDKPQGMWSFVRDITDRKQTQDELMKKINDLERYKNITVGRELRIIELKEKAKKLEQKLETMKEYKNGEKR